MLIVNADDLGRNQTATDNTLRCHAGKSVGSTSAMVFMKDSERAAELALASGIDAGLHVNYSESFTAGLVPEWLREDQERIRRFLKASKYALLFYHPGLRGPFRHVFQAQYDEFTRLFRREPTHLDGHQHLHLATNVLSGDVLPAGTKVRRSFSFRPGERNLFNRLYRAVVDRCLARRHYLTDYFFALDPHAPKHRLEHIIRLANSANVELMTHPEKASDFGFLMGDTCRELLNNVPAGTFAALTSVKPLKPSPSIACVPH